MARQIALVSIGKIARDQHIPAFAASPDWDLAAAVSRNASVEGVPSYTTLAEMLENHPEVEAVSLCMPPNARFAAAAEAIAAGRHVMLEKPPGATVSECYALAARAAAAGVSLFATWHSREAAAVDAAREWLAGQVIQSAEVIWKEDVRRWHPGQDWIWQPGGVGVFDPGINALSVLTKILPYPVHLSRAVLKFPANRQTPIAATLEFADPTGAELRAEFDWRQEGTQTWDIRVKTESAELLLTEGGAKMLLGGREVIAGANEEYPRLYRRMADLVARGESDADFAPLIHVADAFLLGERRETAAFYWDR